MSLLPLLTFALGGVGSTSGLAVLGGLGSIVAGLGGRSAGGSRHGTSSDAGAHGDAMRCGAIDVGSGVSKLGPRGGFGELCCGLALRYACRELRVPALLRLLSPREKDRNFPTGSLFPSSHFIRGEGELRR